MEEERYSGEIKLSDQATMAMFEYAILQPCNKTVSIHKPGSTVECGGKTYVVDKNGCWRRQGRRAEG